MCRMRPPKLLSSHTQRERRERGERERREREEREREERERRISNGAVCGQAAAAAALR